MTRRTSVVTLMASLLVAVVGCGPPKPPAEPSAAVPGVTPARATPTPPTGLAPAEAPAPVTPPPPAGGAADAGGRPKPHYYNRVVAVGIGVSRYRHVADKAEYAERDAEQVLTTLRDRYGFETVALTGSAATRKTILDTLEKLKRELGEKDVLIVYFAGHGQVIDLPDYGSAGYLVPYDADLRLTDTTRPDEWEERAVDMRGLTRTFEGTDVRHVLFVVDACCSGFMTRRGDFPARSDLQELMLRRSRTVLAATTDRRPAYPDNDTGHGFFTGPLLAALRTDAAQSVTELFLAAQRQTVAASKRTMLPQRGEFGAEYGEFVFLPKAISPAELDAALGERQEAEVKRSARRTRPEHLYDLLDTPPYQHSPRRADLEAVWKQRVDRFRENAALGDPLAMAALCLALSRGLGTDGEPAGGDAYREAKKAYASGRPAGKFALGYCLLTGTGVAKNGLAGRELLERASADGFLLANVVLADQASAGTPSPAAAKQVGEWLDQAEAGGVTAAGVRRVALELKPGRPAAAERAKLVARVRPAADAGNAAAQLLVYELLASAAAELGEAEKADALKHLTKAAEAGSAEAQFRLAVECYQKEWFAGRLGRRQDFVAAREWATLAADQGVVEAHKMLAMLFVLGDGVPVDVLTAQTHYKRYREKTPLDIDWWQWFVDHELEAREKTGRNK